MCARFVALRSGFIALAGMYACACTGSGASAEDGGETEAETGEGASRDSDSDFAAVTFPRQMESLGRGMVAVLREEGGVYVGWRLLGTDPADTAFNLYRKIGGADTLLTDVPLTQTTDFVDADGTAEATYYVRPVLGGVEQKSSTPVAVELLSYRALPLAAADTLFERVSVGDLDGDGEYDFVIKQPLGVADPGLWNPSVDTYKLEAYRSDGTFMWRRDLGWNIEQGLWWSPMLVYDLDGDGKAEVVTKTAPLDEDYRNEEGKVLEGPEWLSVLDGETGEELARENWIDRGDPAQWGDDYGNRVNRNKLAIAYLDGRRPSVVVFRGIYRLMKMEAWNFRDGGLTQLWEWSYERGGGFQNARVGDVDGDGYDEIINGSMAVDQDGSDLWITGESHGDRMQLADFDPARPGFEIWYCQEWGYTHPYHLRDAHTGALIWGDAFDGSDNGRAVAADVDPSNPGMEMWSSASPNLFSANGEDLGPKPESANWAVWWDGDVLRELVEGGRIVKYDGATGITNLIDTGVEERYSERYIGDILGDWREELIYSVAGELRIYTTAVPAEQRFYTFMHDSMYRTDTAAEASGWNQYPNTSFFFGEGAAPPPVPDIYTAL